MNLLISGNKNSLERMKAENHNILWFSAFIHKIYSTGEPSLFNKTRFPLEL